MKFLHRSAPASPITQVVVIFPRSGACLDPPHLQGLTRMTSRMFLTGAGGMSNGEFHGSMERLGASIGNSVANDYHTLRLLTLTRNLDRALDLFLKAIHEPNMDQGEFDRLKEELRSSWISEREESKNLRAQEVYLNRIYGGQPNGYQLDGTEAGIRAITLDEIRSHYRGLIGRSEPLVAVLTDLSRDEAEERIADRLRYARAASEIGAYPWDDFRPQRPKGRRITIIPEHGSQTDEVIAGGFTVGEADPEWHIHRLISLIFGGDMNSRLFRAIRGEHGYSYGASCWYESSHGRCPRDQISPFTMYTFPTVEHTAEAMPVFVSLYEELVDQGVGEEELIQAKHALINSYAFLRDTPQKSLSLDCDEALYGIPFDDDATNRRKMNDVTVEDIHRVLRDTHHPENLTFVLLGDPGRLEPIAGKISGVETVEQHVYPPASAH